MNRISAKQDNNHVLVDLGNAIKTRRKDMLKSQEELADDSGVERSHMGKIERGERNVTLLNLLRIAKALKCHPSDLLKDAGM
ncbi:XRE family transcriptional regulator [Candidatus Parcubacteria bacterium]|jgi:transcriptional regulator with XRE-family HTH domain|nr:MAG: XRE family transcriptional regulator [Candidatus Parcubacteria bacterium]